MGDDDDAGGTVLLASFPVDDKSKSGRQDISGSLLLVGSAADTLLKGDHQKKADSVSKDLLSCRKEAAEAQKICRELNGPEAPKIRIQPLIGVLTEHKPIMAQVLVEVVHICPKSDEGNPSQEKSIVPRKELRKRLKWLKALKAKGDGSPDLQGIHGNAWEVAAKAQDVACCEKVCSEDPSIPHSDRCDEEDAVGFICSTNSMDIARFRDDDATTFKDLEQEVAAKDAEIKKLASSLAVAESSMGGQEFSKAGAGVHQELAELRKAEAAIEESANSLQSESGRKKSVTWSAKLADNARSGEGSAHEINTLREELHEAQSLLKLQASTVKKEDSRAVINTVTSIQSEEADSQLGRVRAELAKTKRQGLRMAVVKESLEQEVSELQKVSMQYDEMKVQHEALSATQASTSRRLEETTKEFVEERKFRNVEAPHLRGKLDFAEQEVSAVLRRLAFAESEAATASGGWAMSTPVPPGRLPAGQTSPRSPRGNATAAAARGMTTAEAMGAATVPSRSTQEAKQKADQLLHVIAEGFDGLLCNVENMREGMARRKNAVLS
mmetsp:Transcript_119969/g.311391  ORF Transcript_119969/g.311391 Transcript_119969/m.311391 type:complete len:554 (+) Transcript_119969:68-1729(+)